MNRSQLIESLASQYSGLKRNDAKPDFDTAK